jgi:hypothetical protein
MIFPSLVVLDDECLDSVSLSDVIVGLPHNPESRKG